ncbi:MAG: GNAT family N-acetyltransferase [Candidatus Thorarchaeota archaeon]
MEFMIRALQESDEEQILEIARNTWGGHDHLPVMFNEWLRNEDCHTVSFVVGADIAALGCLRLIDNGKTAWLEGLRVHQKYQGLGLARKVTDFLRQRAIKLGAERTRLTTAVQSPIPNHLAKSISMRCLYTLNVRWLDLRELHPMDSSSEAVSIPFEKFLDIANSRRNFELVPSGALVYHWYAVDIDHPAIKKLRQLESIEFWYSVSKDKTIDGIAFGFQRLDGIDQEWCTTIYPTDRESLISLLSKQAEFCSLKGITFMMVQFPEQFTTETENDDLFDSEEGHTITLALYEGTLK